MMKITLSHNQSIIFSRYSALLVSVFLLKDSICNSRYLNSMNTIVDTNRDDFDSQLVEKGHIDVANDRAVCEEPKTNIAFLKVHKAASSTVLSILARYAINHDLNIAAPRKSEGFGFNYISYRSTINSDNIVPLPPGQEYNIICNHVVYNRDAFRKIMPNNTVYVGIVRNPETQFLSALNFYMVFEKMQILFPNSNNALTEFLKSPSIYSSKIGPSIFYVHNRMSFDFGLPVRHFDDDQYIQQYFDQLGDDFHLVMITEYFDESLIFLKHLLCFKFKDLLYITTNEGMYPGNITMSDLDKELLRKWNAADFKLYDRFKKKFVAKLNVQDGEFFREVEHFKRTRMLVERYCITANADQPQFVIPHSDWNDAIVFKLSDCVLMYTRSIDMDQIITVRAWDRYDNSKTSDDKQ